MNRSPSHELAAVDRTRDLALLTIGTTEFDDTLPSVPWAEVADLKRGKLLAVVTPVGLTPTTGMVAVEAVSVPPMEGSIPVSVKDGKEGVVVTGIGKELFQPGLYSGFPLRVHDVITHVHGSPTPDLKAWIRVHEEWPLTGEQPRITGEPVTVLYLRAGLALESTVPLGLSHNPAHLIRASSRRTTGFSKAIVAQFHRCRPEHCGSPVIDLSGQVVGIHIATSNVEDLVLSVDEARASLKLLTKLAAEKKKQP